MEGHEEEGKGEGVEGGLEEKDKGKERWKMEPGESVCVRGLEKEY